MKSLAQSGCQERCSDSQANKEFQDRLAKMQAERAKQDSMWTSSSSNEGQTTVQPTEQNSLGVKSYNQTSYAAYSVAHHS